MLRQARLRRNLSLEEAEQATKVRRAFLQALEEERWDLLPARAYAQGLLTVYARTLGLDPAPLVALLPPDEAEASPAPEFEIPVTRPFPTRLVALVVLALAVIIAGGYLLREALADGGLPFGGAAATATPEPQPPTRGPAIVVVTTTAGPSSPATAAPSPGSAASPAPASATAIATPATATPVRTSTSAAAGSSPPAPTATATPAPATATTTPTPTATVAPALVGRPWAQVVELLQAAGITATRQEQVSDTVPQEQVMSQTPAAGEPLGPERAITVVVSLGRAGITVPDVVGRPEAEARTALTQAGLTPGRFANYQGRSDVPDTVLRSVCVGCVLSTSPGAGSVQPQGTTVLLAVRKE